MNQGTTTTSILGVPVVTGSVRSLPDIVELDRYTTVFVLCDTNTHRHCWPLLEDIRWNGKPSVIVIEAGEQAKTLESCQVVWNALVAGHADRHSLLINLGGGVLTDLGGFCAATYMRGIDFVHIPTTLLAMTDAAIGGKHGVDFLHFKNYIGLFVQPEAILVDTAFLDTLPPEQLRNGLAEVIKHGAIGDAAILQTLDGHTLPTIPWPSLIRQSIEVKRHFVERDPLETGLRAALNFGHTVGHAIESTWIAQGVSALHGEAIALGMRVEMKLSGIYCSLAAETAESVGHLIDRYLPDLYFPKVTPQDLIARMTMDKKNVGGEIRFALLKSLEQPVTGCVVTDAQLSEVLASFVDE